MQNGNHSSILKLKELEAVTNMLLKAYPDAQASYNQAVSIGDTKDATRWLGVMDNVNTNLFEMTEKTGQIVKQLELKDIESQKVVSIDATRINRLSKMLGDKSQEVAKMRDRLTDIEGNVQTSDLEQTGNYTQMLVLFLVGLVIAGLISSAAISAETSPAENIILVVAATSLLYHVVSIIA